MSHTDENTLRKTPLHELHISLGGRMVEFTGYSMPVQYSDGIVTEHTHTREKAGLFDVSHMGQVWLKGDSHEHVSAELEKLVPGEIAGLERGRIRYTQFTNRQGGILDDLMVTRLASNSDDGTLYLVINASRKEQDCEWMTANLSESVTLQEIEDRALLAIQGPAAEAVVSELSDGVEAMEFMSSTTLDVAGIECWISRSGYTGEDGFEISVPAGDATTLAKALLAHDDVIACGLGARDSLRLEGGLCLFGNDIDETTSPVEAGLLWSISKRRRTEGGFPGADRIQSEIANGASRKRVGIKPEGRAPARAGAEIALPDGEVIGVVTSGGYGPSVGGPIAMGYVPSEVADIGTELNVIVRGKELPAAIVPLPFVPNNFKR